MQIGLLGLSFLNRFTFQVDAAAGVLTLVENDLAEGGDLRGGRSENQWRMEFAGLLRRIEEIGARRDVTPASRTRMLSELDTQEAEAERQLEVARRGSRPGERPGRLAPLKPAQRAASARASAQNGARLRRSRAARAG